MVTLEHVSYEFENAPCQLRSVIKEGLSPEVDGLFDFS
jgi:hypothetical protein